MTPILHCAKGRVSIFAITLGILFCVVALIHGTVYSLDPLSAVVYGCSVILYTAACTLNSRGRQHASKVVLLGATILTPLFLALTTRLFDPSVLVFVASALSAIVVDGDKKLCGAATMLTTGSMLWISVVKHNNATTTTSSLPVNIFVTMSSMILVRACIHLEVCHGKHRSAVLRDSVIFAAHELRTPIHGIVAASDMLGELGSDSEQARELIAIIKKSSATFSTVLNDILDLGKIDAGKMAMISAPFNVRDAVDDVLACLSMKAGVGVELVCDVDVGGVVLADEVRFKQVITNLAGNSVKFTERGHIVVRVQMCSLPEDRSLITPQPPSSSTNWPHCGVLRAEVSDTGSGMTREQRGALFTEFSDASTITHGTGMGLAITKKIVMLMGGDIGVREEGGEVTGTTFWFYILVGRTTPLPETHQATRLPDAPGEALFMPLPPPHDLYPPHVILLWDTNVVRRRALYRILNQTSATEVPPSMVITTPEELRHYQESHSDVVLVCGVDVLPNAHVLDGGKIVVVGARDARQSADGQNYHAYITTPVCSQVFIDTIVAPLQPQPPPPTRHARFSASSRVLVVDDSDLTRTMTTRMLSSMGLLCDTCVNGRDAVTACEEADYSVVFMDCFMPVMNGLEATRAIRERDARLPIFGLTGISTAGETKACLDAGMTRVLPKPVGMTTFRRVLLEVLDQE